jgi:O-antigen biosynthesis protein
MTADNRKKISALVCFFRLKNHTRASYYHYRRRLSFFVRTLQKAFTGCSLPVAMVSSGKPEELFQTDLELFFSSGARLVFEPCPAPEVSIVLVLHNRAELTCACLASLQTISKNFELIIIDNASTDATGRLLDAVVGARIVRNSENLHFVRAVNQAAALASGTYLLLLNNDTRLLPGAVDSALDLIAADATIGAVGAKVVRFDATLQEAGCIIWQDGSCQGYGRGDSPLKSEYMFQRDVDYCSGVFLLTDRTLFLQTGGFDEAFAPAYYEETDYCMRLRALGKRFVYNPCSIVMHVEFASSTSPSKALALQQTNRAVFRTRHATALTSHCERNDANMLQARFSHRTEQQVLFIDDCVPHAYLGSGYPRSRDLLVALDALGCRVTLYPLLTLPQNWDDVYSDIPRTVEVMAEGGFNVLETFLRERAGYFNAIIVSRPHNMWIVKKTLKSIPGVLAGAKLIYDAEAVFALRDIRKQTVLGKKVQQMEQDVCVEDELNLARQADRVIAVSETEKQLYLKHGCRDVHILGHSIELSMTPQSFSQRRNFLFVGAFSGTDSPNADSMRWFVEEILPLIKTRISEPFTCCIAGNNSHRDLGDLRSDIVEVLGRVDDLSGLYANSRAFIVPTRYAAGIPYKAHHAAAHGLPMVASTLIAGQLGWRHEQEVLSAGTAEDFAEQCVRLYTDAELWNRLRENAAARIEQECSREAFVESVRSIIQ